EHASPVLAQQVATVCSAAKPDARRTRRAVLSVTRYLLRMTRRATPFGLFAGIAPASFGPRPVVGWGEAHQFVAQADTGWVNSVIARLEACPQVLRRLRVVTNSLVFVRGGRLVVPYPSKGSGQAAVAEVSLRYTSVVRIAVEAARAPIRVETLVNTLAAARPDRSRPEFEALIIALVDQGALITSLRAPSTSPNALDHLLEQLEQAEVDELPQGRDVLNRLRAVNADLAEHNRTASAAARRKLRAVVRERMAELDTVAVPSVAVDMRLDCSLVLPRLVAQEVETAASALARLTELPSGSPAWRSYHNRFFERYGIGSLVPVRELVDPDIGLGFPSGYLDAEPEPPEPVAARQLRLLALAQTAALDGRQEVVLDEELIGELQIGERAQPELPPHLELRFRLQAASPEALARGDFQLAVVGTSRGIGTTTGRFISLLSSDEQAKTAALFEELPVGQPGALAVQMSFPPLDRSHAQLARAPELLAATIGLAEHRPPGPSQIGVDDLAVGCDRNRLYLASVTRQRRLEPLALHALDLRAHTPPLARFLIEIAKAQAAVVSSFSWGPAGQLPFVPRLRVGRTILSSARWRLHRSDLPGQRAPLAQWQECLHQWRHLRRVPDVVALSQGDRLLPLDLSESAHIAVLRSYLNSVEVAVLTETVTKDDWFDGHAHEIVAALTAVDAEKAERASSISTAHLLRWDHGQLPGASLVLLAKLYSSFEQHPEILGRYLPDLLAQWDEPPRWWFLRYRDPHPHLRLRFALNDPSDFGLAAGCVGAWAAVLRDEGLIGETQFATSFPETGRWGKGVVMDAAEEVFAADSQALVVQFTQADRVQPEALMAANLVSIAIAFTGRARHGMDWLIRHGRVSAPRPVERPLLHESVRLADPSRDWQALRAVAGGKAVLAAWQARDLALAHYRNRLRQDENLNPDLVLDSLLHAHHIRAAGLAKENERTCVQLARATALAWSAQHPGSTETVVAE
ncbi:lantibiotic dehydratase, partial [Actinomadura adrarensis]